MRLRRTLGICLALLTVPLALTRADGLVRDGVGAISTGRGGTNIAHSDNGAILLDNPAGMANLTVDGFYEIGVDAVITDIDYGDLDNLDGVDGKFRVYPSPNLAYIRKAYGGDIAYGIGIFAPAGFGAEYEMNGPLTGPTLYKSLGLLGKVLPGVAVRLTDRLTVGGTFGVAVCHTELEGPFFLQTGALRGVPTDFDLQVNGATPTGSIGLQYQLSERTTIGVTYTEESRFTLEGEARANVYGLAPVPLASNFDAEMDITWPRSVGFGVKHDLSASHRVSADVIWYNWSEAFDQLDLRLSNSSLPIFTQMLGPTIYDAFPLGWDDTVSLRLGYEWERNPRDVYRLGYVYHESPVPNETLCPYIDGVLEHAFTVGYSRRCTGYILSAAYEYSFSPTRHVGDSALAGGDFANSSFRADAHWLSLSLLVPF
jgi:long-subunit fatty acid transport protein